MDYQKVSILCKNKEDFDDLMKYLEKNTPCRWVYDNKKPTQVQWKDSRPVVVIDTNLHLFLYGVWYHWYGIHTQGFQELFVDDIIRKKIVNLEDDPFGEENYGYVKENAEQKFHRNDIVELCGTVSGLNLNGKKGRIVLTSNNIQVMSDRNKYGICDYKTYNGIGYYVSIDHRSGTWAIPPYNILDIMQRKLDFENDPFGEDSLGFVKEGIINIVNNNIGIKFNNEEEYNRLMCYLEEKTKCVWISGGDKPTETKYNSTYMSIYNVIGFRKNSQIYLTDHKTSFSKIYNVDSVIPKTFKGKIRKINLEDDPFGEENYGYLKENIDYRYLFDGRHTFCITCDTENEYKELLRLLDDNDFRWKSGHVPTTMNYFHQSSFIHCETPREIGYGRSSWIEQKIINFKNLNYKSSKRVLNLEDDPFGEEDYRYKN